jgi:uncharacterized protein (DUF2126 family)
VLYVFMPPLARLEDYLDLVAAVEATARDLGVKIVMEGYPPPRDPRLKMLQVTPDPGVIEVNIHPAHNWKELVDHTEFLYNAAFETRLSAEKFMTDGRHTGTGGGNHFVMGGATPADAPSCAGPSCWPACCCTGTTTRAELFVLGHVHRPDQPGAARGRGAQRPALRAGNRAEGDRTNRELYGQAMPAWLVDRTLRNILIDVTGNTHRSEFCIDKLYSPDSSTGRLGLLELRAFEMPPHARMSVVQQLLLRALVARFWDEPYKAPVTRWGTELHDRWLLPTFIWMDFDDVISEDAPGRLRLRCRLVRAALRVPLSRWAADAGHGRGAVAAQRAGALARDGRGRRGRRHGALRRFVAGAHRGAVTGLNESRHVITVNGKVLPLQPPAPRASSWPGCATRPGTRLRRCTRHRRARAADLRPGRHLDEPFAGRLPVLRGPPGRPQLRHLPGERLRGREPPPFALHAHRPHAGADAHAPATIDSRAAANSRSRWICADKGTFRTPPARTAVTGV